MLGKQMAEPLVLQTGLCIDLEGTGVLSQVACSSNLISKHLFVAVPYLLSHTPMPTPSASSSNLAKTNSFSQTFPSDIEIYTCKSYNF